MFIGFKAVVYLVHNVGYVGALIISRLFQRYPIRPVVLPGYDERTQSLVPCLRCLEPMVWFRVVPGGRSARSEQNYTCLKRRRTR